MADIPPLTPPPGPTGAVPPPKKETGKVQPKKETVRINLPPKPTAAPTIKLPTLPPGGPTGAPSAPALAPAPATMKLVDKVLIWLAIVASFAGAGFSGWVCYFVLKPLIENFQQ